MSELRQIPIEALRSNNVPSGEEKELILRHIADAEVDLVSFNDKVMEAYRILRELQSQRQNIISYIEAQRSLFSQIRTIPDEILVEIFLACSHSISIAAGPIGFPWNLTQVCSRWRRIALSCTPLWSDLHLDQSSFPKHSPLRLDSMRELFDLCLQRSSEQLLSLRVVFSSFSHFPFLDRLLSTSHRWERLTFFTGPMGFQPLNILKDNVPELRHLIIYDLHCADQGDTVVAFQDAPKLTHVSLIHFRSALGLFKLPWNQLTHISLRAQLNYREYVQLLRLFQNITNLDVRGVTLRDSITESDTMTCIELPRVQTFSLEWFSDIKFILQPLRLPNLTTLSILVGDYTDKPDIKPISDLLNHSSSHLKKLDVYGSSPADYIIRIFEIAEDIGHLELHTVHSYRGLLMKRLTITSGENLSDDVFNSGSSVPILLPNLHTLSLNGVKPSDLPPLVRMLRSRVGEGSNSTSMDNTSQLSSAKVGGNDAVPLRKLRFLLTNINGADEDLLEELRTFTKDGRLKLNMDWIPDGQWFS
ncbi:hypothetical protein BDQ12DRAFT_404407 [Crucibulum laeve]|uniref:Uncharacterized protein n=1 Tax=Crucibulum laeve TaxID=68775 RepID=A0A5C3LLX7_9AGAR|nr:hypothetical protein BDQ12DRAFT_404407 [Crucibulum laeve]